MNLETIRHVQRISGICHQLGSDPRWGAATEEKAFAILSDFDSEHWPLIKYLSLPLYEETAHLLSQAISQVFSIPEIAIVMAVHQPNANLLRAAIASAFGQIGVTIHLRLSLDGVEGNEPLVREVLSEANRRGHRASLQVHEPNRGVGLCRNAALMQTDEQWFTFLDCDDVFHPLRCLHAWLALKALAVKRLNTGYSRVCLRENKIVLLQQSLSAVGGNSFLACTDLLGSHGYLAPLRFYEDTEYQNRLAHFSVPMTGCTAIGHYQNTELEPEYTSLATRWRHEVHSIEDHPWLKGTVIGEIDDETRAIRDRYNSLYARLSPEQLAAQFPAAPCD